MALAAEPFPTYRLAQPQARGDHHCTKNGTSGLFDVEFDKVRRPEALPFLGAMSRLGITLSVFLALLVGVSFPFVHTVTLRVVDALAAVMVVLLFLVSTVGIRIAERIANRLLDGVRP